MSWSRVYAVGGVPDHRLQDALLERQHRAGLPERHALKHRKIGGQPATEGLSHLRRQCARSAGLTIPKPVPLRVLKNS